MGRPPSIPVEKKTRIVLSVIAGEMSIAEAARREKISEQSIGRWKADFLEAGKTALVAGKSGPSTYDLAFAIHPNGASDFTIGALRTVLEQNLDQIVERAMDNDTCIYDPHCMLTNHGADHGCLYLPETACQLWNRNLSRHHLFGSPDGTRLGFWTL